MSKKRILAFSYSYAAIISFFAYAIPGGRNFNHEESNGLGQHRPVAPRVIQEAVGPDGQTPIIIEEQEDFCCICFQTEREENGRFGTTDEFDALLTCKANKHSNMHVKCLEEAFCKTGSNDLKCLICSAPATPSAIAHTAARRYALFLAIRDNNLAEIEALIAAETDLEAINRYGDTPLLYAVCAGYLDIVPVLIGAGARVNARNNDGITALHYAVKQRNLRAVELLLNAGADIDARDNDGRTPLHCAVIMADFPLIILRKLLLANANPNAQDRRGQTPLIYAASILGDWNNMNRAEKLRFLIEFYADVNIQDEDGRTALHYAIAGNCRPDEVLALIHAGADIQAKDKYGHTASRLTRITAKQHFLFMHQICKNNSGCVIF